MAQEAPHSALTLISFIISLPVLPRLLYRAASASVAVDGKAIQLLWTFPCLAKTSFLPPPRPTLSSLHADTDAMSTMTQLDKKAKRTIMRILHTNMDTVSEPSLTEMRVDVVSTPSTHRLMH